MVNKKGKNGLTSQTMLAKEIMIQSMEGCSGKGQMQVGLLCEQHSAMKLHTIKGNEKLALTVTTTAAVTFIVQV